MPGLLNIRDIAVSTAHACAVGADGELLCWGANDDRQCGVPLETDVQVPTPTQVETLLNVTSVSVAHERTCAVTRDGHAHCFGNNEWGRAAGPTASIPPFLPVALLP